MTHFNLSEQRKRVTTTMEQIKKKLAALKQERDDAVDRAEEAEREKKEADARADAVSSHDKNS